MLERIASSILTKYLGDYVEGLDRDNLSISVTAGDAVLNNLRLKKSALQNLELPIEVKEGFLTKLTLNIPWKSIGSKPAIIRIKGVYIIATPKSRTSKNAEEEIKRKLASKLQQLQIAEALGLDTVSDDDEKKSSDKKNEGFFARLAMKVVDNLQIFIDDIHIRYEDKVSNPKNPICFGITLDSLHAQSTDAQWKPTFLNVGESIVHKLVTLSNFAIYLNTTPQNNSFLNFKNIDEMVAAMKKLIPKNDNPLPHHYILKPTSGVLKASIDRGDELVLDRPKVTISSELESFVVSINSNQFKSIMDIVEYITKYFKTLNYAELKPPSHVRPKDDPKRWWKYVFDCVSQEHRKKIESWKWVNIQAHIDSRQTYIDLYKKRQKVGLEKMSTADKKQIEGLEAKLEYQDIILFRKLANASLKKEQKKEKESGGFFSRFFGGKSKDPEQTEQDKEAALKELYTAIDYNEQTKSTEATVFPKDYVKILVDFKMKLGAFELRQDDTTAHPLLTSFNYHHLNLKLKLREGSTTLRGELGSIEMTEYHTLQAQPLVILKPDLRIHDSKALETSNNFMTVQLDLNPIDTEKPLDVRLGVHSKPLLITFSRSFIDRIVSFFTIESTHTVQRISNAATAGLDQLKASAETGLKFTLENKKKIKLDINLDAPKIIAPIKFDDPHAAALVLDLGKISFWSDPYASESSVDRKGQDIKVSENYFYDNYTIDMEGLHAILIQGDKASWQDIFSFDHDPYSIINRFDLNFKLMVCTENSTELPKVKVIGGLQNLSLEFTQPRILLLLDVIQSFVTTDEPEPAQLTSRYIEQTSSTKEAERLMAMRRLQHEPYSIVADVDFTVSQVSVIMYGAKTIVKSDVKAHMIPLVDVNLSALGLHLLQANHEMKVDVKLGQILINDTGYPELPILTCEQSTEGLLDIKYIGIPKGSPLYEKVDHQVHIVFGHILVNVNRPTIAGLLQTFDDLNKDIQAKALPVIAPKREDEVEEVEEEAIVAKELEIVDEDFSLFVFSSTLKSIKVHLNKEASPLTTFELSKSSLALDVKGDSCLSIEGHLGNISLDYFEVSEHWRNLLSVQDHDEIISFKFNQYSKTSKHYPGHDMDLSLRMQTVNVVFLNKTIKEFTDYFAAFAKMRNVISAASYYYYSISMDALQEAAKNLTKFKFDIEIQAPHIIIPLSSHDTNHITLSLGNISVSNKFVQIQGMEMDHISVSLENLHATSHILTEANVFEPLEIIEDTKIDVDVKRALYPDNVLPQDPEVEVSAKIPTFRIGLRETQLALILDIVSHNVSEESCLKDDPEIDVVINALKNVDYDLQGWTQSDSVSDDLPVSDITKLKVRLFFLLSEVQMVFYRGNGMDLSTHKTTELLTFTVNTIDFDFDMYSDASMRLEADLRHIILEDTRQDTEIKFRRIWAPLSTDVQVEPQFKFLYEMKPLDHMTTISLCLHRPLLTLVPESLKEIYTFTMKNVNLMTKSLTQPKVEKEKKEETEIEEEQNVMKLEISIQSPEICVVENPLQEKVSAFVLHLGNSMVKMSQASGQMKLGLNLNSFDMYRCIMSSKDAHVRDDITKLLQPITIEANLGLNEEGVKRMSIDLGIITTIVSYSDIKRMLIIYQSFEPFIQALSNPVTDEISLPSDSTDVAQDVEIPDDEKQVPLDLEDSDQEAVEVAIPLDASDDEDEPIIKGNMNMMIIISLKAVLVSLLNDRLYTHPTPVLKLSLENNEGMLSFYDDGASEIYYSVETLEMSSYNNQVSAIEPIIEPWSMSLHLQQTTVTKMLHMEAQEVFDINVTKSLLDTFFSINDLLKEVTDERKKEGKTLASKKMELSFDPYVIKNQLSVDISYNLTEIPNKVYTVASGNQAAIKRATMDRKQASERPIRYSIDIRIPDEGSEVQLSNIPISKVGKQCFLASKLYDTKYVIVDVEEANGTKFITLRSSISILNNTSKDIELSMIHPANDVEIFRRIIKEGDTTHIPIDYAYYNTLRFRPHGLDYDWFEWNKDVKNDKSTLLCPHQRLNTLWACNIKKTTDAISMEVESKKKEKSKSIQDDVNDETVELLKTLPKPVSFTSLTVHDLTISLEPILKFENTLCSDMSIRLINKDEKSVAFEKLHLEEFESVVIYELTCPFNLENKQEYYKKLSNAFLASFSLTMSVKGFEWSDVVPLKKDTKKIRFNIPDRLSRDLILYADMSEDDDYTKTLTIYSEYWIINHTGLNLFYKPSIKSEDEAAGQNYPSSDHSSVFDKSQDPQGWYKDKTLDTVQFKYNTNRFYYHAKRISIRVEDSMWSKDFPLGVKNEGVISIQDQGSGREFNFAVTVEPGPGKLWRTKVVTISPAFILVNRSSRSLLYRQSTEKISYEVGADQSIPFYWTNFQTEGKTISISDKSNESAWSPDISIFDAGSFKAKLRNALSREELVLDIIIKNVKGVTYVVLGDGTQDIIKVISYKIVNHTNESVSIQQVGSDAWDIVSGHNEMNYSWDEPQVQQPKLYVHLSSVQKQGVEVELDIIAKSPEIPYLVRADGQKFKLEVKAEGDQKTLIISEDEEEAQHASLKLTRELKFQFKLAMRGIGVSIIDDAPQELLYMSMQTIYMDLQISNIDKSLEFSIGMAQIDNQLYNSQLPILLYSMPIEGTPFFHLSLLQDATTQKVQFFKYFGVRLAEIDLSVDEALVIRLLAFFESFFDYMVALDQEEQLSSLLHKTENAFPCIPDDEISSTDIFYFEMFHINPIRANVTYMANPSADHVVLKADAIQKILGYIGKLTNIERAPLELNCLILEHPYCSKQDLVSRIVKHYTLAAVKQAYLILGSSDFIGNPVSLISNLGTGVKDFFYEPAKGIVKSPKEFGKGLAKGTTSLVKKSIYGLFDTTSKLTGTVAKVGATLTLDSEYQKERSLRNQVKARHAGEGIAYGVRDFGIGVFKGITGVVVQPIKGAKREGALGFFKGIGKGLTGIVLKPAIGAVDLITRTTEGIKNTTTFFDEKSKVPIRPPRYIPEDKVVMIYNFEKSLGKQILKSLEDEQIHNEPYISHVMLLSGDCLMITKKRILFIEQSIIRLGYQWSIEWNVEMNHVVDVHVNNNGKSISVEAYVYGAAENKMRTVDCSNTEEARLVYQKIISSGVTLRPVDAQEKIMIEKTLGDHVFEIEEMDMDIDDSDMKARRTKRQRQRQQKYASERTRLLGEGEKERCCGGRCCCCGGGSCVIS